MTITNSVIISQTIQREKTILVHERHTDHVGKTYEVVYYAPEGADVDAIKNARMSRIEAILKEQDLRSIVFSDDWDYPLTHVTKTELGNRIRELYLESKKQQTVILAKRIREWVTHGRFSDTQIKTVFGLTSLQYSGLKTRMIKMIEHKDAIDVVVGE